MRVSGLELPAPLCLSSVRATRATGDVRDKLVKLFISDEEDARSRAWHESLERTEAWISTREELEVWMIGCPCGADKGKVFGARINDEFSAPIYYACGSCSARSMLFDPDQHGYNAEVSKRKRKARKLPEATWAMHCRDCKTTLWHAAVLVTYQGDIDAKFHGRLADFFDVILIGGACGQCGAATFRYDAECA